jgi:hypothetical protein
VKAAAAHASSEHEHRDSPVPLPVSPHAQSIEKAAHSNEHPAERDKVDGSGKEMEAAAESEDKREKQEVHARV